MKELERLRAYYRKKYHFPVGDIFFPWVRNRAKALLSARQIEELVRTTGDFLVPVDSSIPETRRVQMRGDIDLGMEWVVRRYAKPGTTVIDVGANLGYMTLCLADRVGVAGKVIAAEPNIEIHGYINELLHLNAIDNVTLLHCACSEREGVARFSVNRENHTMSKLDSSGDCEVKLLPVDSLVADVDVLSFIKIDVEGHEVEVFRGAKETLKNKRPTLVFETGLHSSAEIDEINQILADCKYEVIGVIRDWGVERKALTLDTTTKSHCNVLALSREHAIKSLL